MSDNQFLRFNMIHYPLWRRRVPRILEPLRDMFLQKYYPVSADRQPPQTAKAMAQHLQQWHIVDNFVDVETIKRGLMNSQPILIHPDLHGQPTPYEGGKLSIPAQWERTERVLLSWAIHYPLVWEMHAQMVEAISAVADVEILIPHDIWASAVHWYLAWRGKADLSRIRFLLIPTDDIWIRDYGPVIAVDDTGNRVAINPNYAVLPQYPQAKDNAMPQHFAMQYQLPIQPLDLHTEGGNLWSDGAGTLLMSSQIFYSNPYYDRARLVDYLHEIFDFQKLIITPRLTLEETGHIDLIVKLADRNTILLSKAESLTTNTVLRKTKRLFQRETNALGEPYNIIELPTPPLYLNWFVYAVRRTYTNALTINGRVLVPIYKIPQDEIALRIYEQAMPDYDIIPIDASEGIHGLGAVHCMTKEIPAL